MGNYFACSDDELDLAEMEDAGLVPMRPSRARAILRLEQEFQRVQRVNQETLAKIHRENSNTPTVISN